MRGEGVTVLFFIMVGGQKLKIGIDGGGGQKKNCQTCENSSPPG